MRNKKRRAAQKAGYRSDFEWEIAKKAKRSRIKFRYEHPDDKVIWYDKAHVYKPDFRLDNGIIVEAKGRLVSRDRTKHLRIKEQHPELDIRFIFQANNTLTPKSKTRYTDWADKHGFKWAMKHIPKEWSNE